MKKNKFFAVLLILLPLAIGLLSAYITSDEMALFNQINKPPLSPPAWLFPIAWTILYLLMGIAAAIVYTSQVNNSSRKIGLLLHCVQLILNFFWSLIFFNMKAYLFSFLWLVLLWLSVFSMIIAYKNVSKSAYLLNIPYLCWLTFAAYLNLAIFILN